LLSATNALACTGIGIGKDASSTGFPMITHSEDGEFVAPNDVRLIRVPRRKWPIGSLRPLYHWQFGYPRIVSAQHSPEMAPVGDQKETEPLAHIPQVPETWAYWDTEYGVQNEWGVAMGGGTCTAKTAGWPVRVDGQELSYGHNHVGIEDLSKIALERCKTAVCAVETMGAIAVEQGYYVDGAGDPAMPAFGGSADCLLVADAEPGELWAFHVLTGRGNKSAIWAAQRFPANHVAVVANAFTIRTMNLSDTDNFRYSPGMTDLAEEKGWWSHRDAQYPEHFDFFRAYGYTPKATGRDVVNTAKLEGDNAAALARAMAYNMGFYSGRRMWRVFSLLSPLEGGKLDPNQPHLPEEANNYPPSMPAPRGSVTPRMVMDVHRDHYEGTPFDLTKGVAAGPFGNPNRGGGGGPGGDGWGHSAKHLGHFERALAMERTNWCFLNEFRPQNRSIMWFAWDSPHGSVFLPFYASATAGAPESYHSHEGHMSKFSRKVAWWAYNWINQYSEINFQAINSEVRSKVTEVEDEAQHRILLWEAEADKLIAAQPGEGGKVAAMELLTARSNAFAEEVLARWWDFSEELMSRFGRHVVTRNESVGGVYFGGQRLPDWWLNSPEVGYIVPQLAAPVAAAASPLVTSPSSTLVVSFAGTMVAVATAYQLGRWHGRQDLDRGDRGYYSLPA